MPITQPYVTIDVRYFDAKEKKQFSKYPNFNDIEQFAGKSLKIPTSEFLTYFLYGKKQPELYGWRNHKEIGAHILRAEAELEDFVIFNGKSINMASGITNPIRILSERLGEAIGLSVVNRFHNLTEADWDQIPIHSGPTGFKTFDYVREFRAGSLKHIVQLETKGTVVNDVENHEPNTRTHRSNIEVKKIEIVQSQNKETYKYPSDIRYGTVSSIGKKMDSVARCWLVDPEPEEPLGKHTNFRLLARMRFVRDWVRILGRRTMLAVAINNRVQALENLEHPFELDNVSLVQNTGEPFKFGVPFGDEGHVLFSPQSQVLGERVSGAIVRVARRLIFIGISNDLIATAVNQSFKQLIEFRSECKSIRRTVFCNISRTRYEREFEFFEASFESVVKLRDRVEFRMSAYLHFSPAGIVFGSAYLDI